MRPWFLLISAVVSGVCTVNCSNQNFEKTQTNLPQQTNRDFLPKTQIFYSANVYGEIEPCGCRSNPTGGLIRQWEFIHKSLKTVDKSYDSLFLDSGDLFYQSSPVPPFLRKQWDTQALALVEALNRMGYTAFTPGELDFAGDLEAFDKIRKTARFEFISANILNVKTGKPYLKPYIILKRSGMNVAIFGLYDETLGLPEELRVENHIDVAKKLVPELKRKAQVIVALTHIGYEKDVELARTVPGIDAIFGAHTQSFLQEPVKIDDTLIFQASFRSQHLGLYAAGINKLTQLDTLYDPQPGKSSENPMVDLVIRTKQRIAEFNRDNDRELGATPPENTVHVAGPHGAAVEPYQTFVKCADCHQPQFEFYRKTRHGHAYATLVNKKQNYNKDCLKCHTLAMNETGGWKHVTKLVFNAKGQPVSAEDFAHSLPQMTVTDLSRYQKSFINVQCEHCHGAGLDHPWSGQIQKNVSTDTCLKCHTEAQAPSWYSGGKPRMDVLAAKKKLVSCPTVK